jgi:anaerobic glycerol-3-phosphate dehydrogenase C subunit
MHIRPMMDMKDKADLLKMDNIADDFYRMVIALGGSISAEHGDGILRVPYLKKQFGPLYNMFCGIKEIFDPKGILNPGKKIGKDEKVTHDLVYDADIKYAVTGSAFDSESVREEVERCHACGLCRNVCPVNIALPQESASPRAKAAVIKGVMTGELNRKLFRDPAIKDLLGLCINCKSCRVECPTGADISQICSMAREILVKEWGVGFSQALLERMRLLGSASARAPGIAKIMLSSSLGKFLAGLILGVDSRRTLPVPSGQALTVKAAAPARDPRRKALYFSGCYVDFFNSEGEGAAVLKVLRKNNIGVSLPAQKCCGMPSISSGNIEGARKDIAYNIKELYESAKAGYDIITSCPSCGLALKEDYPRIISTPEAMLIAQKTYDIHEYLWMLLNEGEMNTNFKSSNKSVVFHTPCHLKAHELGGLQESLVELIPGISIKKISDSCCGMAGTFGLRKENFDLSVSIGKRLFDQIKSSGADYVVTGCGSCKTQITQFTSAKVVHPIELLSEYYF